MSVVLTLLRFEIEDKCEKLPNLSYQAPHVEFPHGKTLSYAEVAAAAVQKQQETVKYRGSRNSYPITIESYKTLVNTFDEEMAARFAELDLATLGSPPRHDVPSLTTLSAALKQKLDSGELDASPSPPLQVDTGKLTEATTTPAVAAEMDTEESTPPPQPTSRPNSAKRSKSYSPLGESSTIHFFSGNPSVEKTEGIIHLFKKDELTSADSPRSEMLCMFAIPTTMTSQDLLQFVKPVEAWIEHMNIIRDGKPNQYMMLIKFRNQKFVDEVYKHFNGKQFNSIEPEICHLIYVGKVESVKSSEGAGLPMEGMTELPVCPVCLERMDETVSSVLTILCNHSFHGACLAQWGDSTCPVCRYVQTPEGEPDNTCSECTSKESLWICLICGHVGCGRYVGGHAYSHFGATNHTYSMQLGNNRVWDYAGDNYVHRLVQSKGDGKMVAVDEGGNVMEDQDEKFDSINLEYTYLLTSQLESQRHYYEEKMEQLEKQAFKQLEEVDITNKKALDECKQQEIRAVEAVKEKQMSEKKSQQIQYKLGKVQEELAEEKAMNRFLRDNQAQWQTRVEKLEAKLEAKDKEVQELQEQLRDIMFYVEAQQQLAKTTEVSQEEIQDSHVTVSPAAGAAAGARRARKKGR